ncbi:dihydrolipoyllysine-residue acetyltransferase [Ottowia testudinis]|uniref:Acetyltransferase component of pyruvate dehydrogenase complex n=1 Tax=Ottowia testudinis TaxID=2816950 RepID=A0A975H241_9BURK|nr:dihydrolipoyllysine-residue acetyltransferase [Ottowia testudinis]QTD43801.1 dihydrolipoyllysine-residue acetyltransferase [Ottowia testudinis]
MALVEVKVPDIGDFKDVAVIELLVKPGDTVKAEQSLITVESDKASMEIPSSATGVVKELKVKIGDTVNEGTLLLLLEAAGDASNASLSPVGSAPAAAKSEASTAASAANAEAPVGGSEVVPGASQASASARAADTAGAGSAGAPAAGGAVEVRVPDIGDSKDVTVIEVFVKPGDTVKVEQSLITVESDKASMEIPSSAAGVIKDFKVKLGDKVNQGDLLAVLQVAGAAPAAAPSPAGAGEGKAAVPAAAPSPQPSPASGRGSEATPSAPAHDPTKPPVGLPYASPSVRKFARELGVPLDEVKGSGPKGRITQDDVQNFTKAVMAGTARTKAQGAAASAAGGGVTGGGELNLIPWPKVDFAKFGPIERKEMSRIKKISGANLMRNAVMIPAVTNHDDADITDLEAFRVSTNKENEKSGVKVTMLAFVIKACVAALKKFPEFNSSLDGDALVYKQYWHIGFAADTPNGLMVPVIKDADQKGVLAISKEMGELAAKARDGKLSPAEMSGATFTISSLGGIGGRYFTPIINAPEVAILGVCRSTTEPVWDGKSFQPRLMLPLSLTWDHRVIDGAAAARFNAYLGQILGDFRRVLL